jgi:hypothetical protein
MGEGTDSLDPEEQLDEVSARIEKSRERLDVLVSELDHRRHVVTNLRRNIDLHPWWAVGSVAVAVALVGGGVALAVHRHRQRETLTARADRLRTALNRMIERPNKVAPSDGGIAGKVMMAAVSAATGVLVKRLAEQAVAQALKQEPAPDRPR